MHSRVPRRSPPRSPHREVADTLFALGRDAERHGDHEIFLVDADPAPVAEKRGAAAPLAERVATRAANGGADGGGEDDADQAERASAGERRRGHDRRLSRQWHPHSLGGHEQCDGDVAVVLDERGERVEHVDGLVLEG